MANYQRKYFGTKKLELVEYILRPASILFLPISDVSLSLTGLVDPPEGGPELEALVSSMLIWTRRR